ncbi:glycosyltransferase family 25 protein [Castellaniella sp.]|uniref:glycosyltransferase family 25 protein n=1 Tax=Castellaniella sp. TaxID=1955812 RepID=UPI002AFF1B38|nr:glycosyltransferase family 25 protein [Castellaniella sp.]
MIYIVSLYDAADRRLKIQRRLDALGVEFSFIDALNAKEHDHIQDLVDGKKVYGNIHRHMTDVEIACAFSHRQIYREILKKNLPGAVVLEDDVIVGDGFAYVCQWFMEHGELFRSRQVAVHLGVSSKKGMDALLLNSGGVSLGTGARLLDVNQKFSEEAWGAYAYYISHDLANAILGSEKIVTVADQWSVLTGGAGGAIKVLSPACCAHPEISVHSTLEAGRAVAKFEYLKSIYKDPKHVLSWVYRKTILKYIIRPFLRRKHVIFRDL